MPLCKGRTPQEEPGRLARFDRLALLLTSHVRNEYRAMHRSFSFALAATGSLTLLFAGLHAANPDYRSAKHPLGDFHRWTKLNPEPALLDSYVDELCGPGPKAIHQREVDPHAKTFITVWVNGTGREAMLNGKNLPVGTVIVKEKLATEKGPVTLSTAMIKREKGYSPTCGDWEFAVLDAQGSMVTKRGRLETCMMCHAEHKRNDHTFRFYLPGHFEDHWGFPTPFVVDSGGWFVYPFATPGSYARRAGSPGLHIAPGPYPLTVGLSCPPHLARSRRADAPRNTPSATP